MTRPIVYHIPVCPFCQRLEILLSLKGRRHEGDFLEPHWRTRPWPPKNKYERSATDEELRLVTRHA